MRSVAPGDRRAAGRVLESTRQGGVKPTQVWHRDVGNRMHASPIRALYTSAVTRATPPPPPWRYILDLYGTELRKSASWAIMGLLRR